MIIRSEQECNYTIIPNAVLNDPDLKLDELGLLCYLISKPAGWKVKPEVLAKEKGMSRNTVYKKLNSLIEAGYILRKTTRQDGKIASFDYYVYDAKQTIESTSQISTSQKATNRKATNRKLADIESTESKESTEVNKVKKESKQASSNDDENTHTKNRSPNVLNIPLPDVINREAWCNWVQHRKELKKPVTSLAAKRAIKLLMDYQEQKGLNPNDMLEGLLDHNWAGIYIPSSLRQPNYQNKGFDKVPPPPSNGFVPHPSVAAKYKQAASHA